MKKLAVISLSLLAFGLVACHKSTEEKCRDGDMEACSEVFHKAVNDAQKDLEDLQEKVNNLRY